ncbi:MAG: S1 RNA-binding domain-containing protein [Parvularculaceae bacterium]
MAQAQSMNPSRNDFAGMLRASLLDRQDFEESVVTGVVTAIEKDVAVIDVGLKTEGRVPLKEFGQAGMPGQLKVGDKVEVYVERIENANGEAVISRDKARREEAWDRLEDQFKDEARVRRLSSTTSRRLHGRPRRRCPAFLPGSQVRYPPRARRQAR